MAESNSNRSSRFSLSRLAIRQHIGTMMLTLTVIVLGVFFLFRIPVDLLPSITYPRIGVRVDAPGLSPEVAVDEVTRPLERALSATDGVEQVFSQTREGRISVDLFFKPGGDLDRALNDATASLNRARSTLPDEIDQPRLFRFDPSQLPVYEFALTSQTVQGVDLRVFAEEELARELNVIPGVASVSVSGGIEEEVQVNLDLARLQALGLGLNSVLDALRDRNQDIAGGRLEGGRNEPLTRTIGQFASADEIRNLAFDLGSSGAARQVYLREFAEVIDGTAKQRVRVNLNGSPAVKITIQKQPDANTVTVVDRVKQKIATLQAANSFPPDTLLTATLDESVFIRNSIRNLTTSGLIGATLAAIAVLLFLGSLRQTLIIVLAIPLATLVAIGCMKLAGLSLNVFSLGGLALGVGIVVDNAIVMLESIVIGTAAIGTAAIGTERRGRLSKQALLEQSQVSSQELESALVASTTTNLVAVLPFLLIGGLISLLFNELILTISFAVAASLAVALTVVPMLTARLLGVRWRSNIGNLWLLKQFRQQVLALRGVYGRWLDRLLRWRLPVIILALLILGGGSWQLGQTLPQEILPRISTGQAQMFVSFPPGTTVEQNQQAMQAIDAVLTEQPELDYVFSTAGGFLFSNITISNPLRGSSTITLKPGTDVQGFTDRMNRELQKLNLVQTRIRLSPGRVRGLSLRNSPVRADIDVILQGTDDRTLSQAGRQILSALDEQATLASYRPDADRPQPEVQIKPDWERATTLGVTIPNLGRTLQTAITGTVPTRLQRGDRLVDIRVQLKQGQLTETDQLNQLPLFTRNGQLVRLGDAATIVTGQAPGEIQRINQREVFIITGSLKKNANLGAAAQEMQRIANAIDLPEGVRLLPSGAAAGSREVQRSISTLGLLAAFLVFVVMAVQYNSLIDPLVIMVTVPLALAGGILGLAITQTAIGATVLIGAVLLVGIVVNNAIIMVELANQLRTQEDISATAAILKAAPQRLQPILMTTITTVLGMLPLALGIGEGSEFLQPLGIVVFSGLSVATLLTLFLIPCIYSLSHDGFIRKQRIPKPDKLIVK
ncbi:efflux RND transporter permease subunit [filamentous cyanobacterium LEGE 11480]|uniref:Efflux RND transporter permease subunit n=1 Tax=Romeriopsis navalis LEGE 11480 TaxID=2777977 RepID=A0A928Z558_9CYAN|nr:efflux RND transporter permease subunit [Romeriopsis navalis]MBE9031113.1 efflux RND transporter permease subunit [Romeriopsis navalis LEGE 11480]